MKAHVNKYAADFNDKLAEPVGCTSVDLDGLFEHVRAKETNFTNFVSDIVRTEFSNVDWAMMNCGGFRSNSIIPAGEITRGDIRSTFPDEEKICLMKLKVPMLHQVLENAVSKYPSLEGRFPSVSGFRFAFDPSKPGGSRIDINSITDRDGNVLPQDKYFTLAVKHFVRQGGDGFDVLKDCECIKEAEDSKCTAEVVLNFMDRCAPMKGIEITEPTP
jgi:5'-nucleotidase